MEQAPPPAARSMVAAPLPLLLILLVLGLSVGAAAGDSVYGKVTAVKRADLVTFDHGAGSYDVRLVGIELPENRAVAEEATRLVTRMLLGKPARLRFEGRGPNGEMVGRIHTDDPVLGIKDVGVEVVRAGLATPQRTYRGFKYDEPAQAMKEARAKKLGLWSNSR